jgi:hypothetical protein
VAHALLWFFGMTALWIANVRASCFARSGCGPPAACWLLPRCRAPACWLLLR